MLDSDLLSIALAEAPQHHEREREQARRSNARDAHGDIEHAGGHELGPQLQLASLVLPGARE